MLTDFLCPAFGLCSNQLDIYSPTAIFLLQELPIDILQFLFEKPTLQKL